MLKNFIQIAIRNLRHNKSATLLNISGLGLGITGAVLIFLFLQNHLSYDRHQADFNRLYRVVLNLALDEGTEYSTDSSIPLAAALSLDYAQIEKVGFVRKLPRTTLSSGHGNGIRRFVESENVVFANPDYMDMFTFDWLSKDAETMMQEPSTVAISEKIAVKYFGTTAVNGKTIRINNAQELRIVGVFKDHTKPSDLNFDFYISLPTIKVLDPSFETENFFWLNSGTYTFVKLTENTSPAQIERSLATNGKKYYGKEAKYFNHVLQPLSDVHFDEKYDGKIRRSILWMFGGVGIFLLVIACINFINLATAQALKRGKNIGIRKVLGSTQRQLFWQFMSETALVTFGSALLALMLVAMLLPVMNLWTHTDTYHFGMLIQFQVLSFFLLTLFVIILLAGFYPSVVISGFNPIAALKSKLGDSEVGGMGLRRSLITFQLVVAQIMVIGMLVLLLQIRFFKNADLGFDSHAVITIPLAKADPQQTLKNNLLQLADVQSVTYQYEAPTSAMGYGGSVRFDNRTELEKFVVRDRFGDEKYLDTYKMHLLAGRSISGKDSINEFVVNEELMQRLGVQDPEKILGKQLEDGNSGFKGTIVGVVKSFHLKSLQVAVEPCVIFAHPKLYKEAAIKLDTKNFAGSLKNIENAWQKAYPHEVFEYQFVDEKIAKFYEKEQQLTTLIQSFAMIAIFICCLGLYGMISFMVTQRTKEIGIRKVLGAGVESIVMLFGNEFMLLVGFAFVFSAPVAWYIMNGWLNNFAYRIDLHWWILASGGIIILGITLLTIGFKVVWAAMMNPVKSLKMD